MRVFVPAETRPGERRVAMLPEIVSRVTRLGLEVMVQSGAGRHAFASDDEYTAAGARIVADDSFGGAMGEAQVVASVRPLDPERTVQLAPGAVTLSFLQPAQDTATIAAVAGRGATALSFDLVPRISRAQSMDALTSQALVTGYRGTLIAAERLPKFFPLFMTAAGTIPPAKVLVLGAGVAGLQAIATAKRLGAKVSAYDVRPASADEVRSMGGTFVKLDLDSIEGAGGYAREMTADRARRQQELLAPFVAESDAVITTAAIPGRPAPLLVTRSMVAGMTPGSIVVDLASESGGNVEGSVPGADVDVGGVTVWGALDLASTMPVHASRLYAMNVVAVLDLISKDGALALDIGDEVVAGAAVVHDGAVRHPAARTALGLPDPAAPAAVTATEASA